MTEDGLDLDQIARAGGQVIGADQNRQLLRRKVREGAVLSRHVNAMRCRKNPLVQNQRAAAELRIGADRSATDHQGHLPGPGPLGCDLATDDLRAGNRCFCRPGGLATGFGKGVGTVLFPGFNKALGKGQTRRRTNGKSNQAHQLSCHLSSPWVSQADRPRVAGAPVDEASSVGRVSG